MSPPEDESRLRDMLDYARRAVEAIRDRSREDLDRDAVLAAALERFIEIIGEAASRVSATRQAATSVVPWRQIVGMRNITVLLFFSYAVVPWRQIVGMRNRLVHGYGAVDRNVLWDVVHDDLPDLIRNLSKELEK